MFSPLDQFETFSLFGFNSPVVGNFYLSLSNFGFYSFLVLIIVIGLHYISNNNASIVPNSYSMAFESLYFTIGSIVRGQIGENKEIYLPVMRSGKTLLRVWLSNSGDILKLLIPSYIWKNISGWINYSGMVISQKIIERTMDNRGSKSNFNTKFVKEQRVDDNRWIKLIHLRCTLMGFERNYQIKIPSNQLKLNKKFFFFYS